MTIEISLLISIGLPLLSFAVTWGMIQTKVTRIERDFDKLDQMVRSIIPNVVSQETMAQIQIDLRKLATLEAVINLQSKQLEVIDKKLDEVRKNCPKGGC